MDRASGGHPAHDIMVLSSMVPSLSLLEISSGEIPWAIPLRMAVEKLAHDSATDGESAHLGRTGNVESEDGDILRKYSAISREGMYYHISIAIDSYGNSIICSGLSISDVILLFALIVSGAWSE